MEGLVQFIVFLVLFLIIISVILSKDSEAAEETREEDTEDSNDENDENEEYEEDYDDDYVYDYSPPNRNSSSESRREERESIEYVPMRLGGSGWLTAGSSFSNPSSAQSSVDYLQRRDPSGTYKVMMKVNGRIVGGF